MPVRILGTPQALPFRPVSSGLANAFGIGYSKRSRRARQKGKVAMSKKDLRAIQNPLTTAQEQVLHEQVIDSTQPGSILRDFQTLLDFIGTSGLVTAGKHCLLPMKILAQLNEQLARPIWHKLKRPQQRSYPNIDGLYLVLRATGLARIEGSESKTRLTIDQPTMARWQQLNATERYFTLLEAWLYDARTEVLGHSGSGGSGWGGECVRAVVTFLRHGRRTIRLKAEGSYNPYLSDIGTNYFHLTLMEMFGFVELEDPGRVSQRQWCPTKVKGLDLGDAVGLLLQSDIHLADEGLLDPGELAEEDDQDEQSIPAFGHLQPTFQRYFPQWQNNLEIPPEEFRDGTYVFKVSLGSVWRRITVRDDHHLHNLAVTILTSFDFDDDHLYQFTLKDRLGVTARVDHPYAEEELSADQICIGALPLRVGQQMRFLYDFGDNWEFDVTLERIDPPNPTLRRPEILEAHGKSPSQHEWEDEADWDEDDEEQGE